MNRTILMIAGVSSASGLLLMDSAVKGTALLVLFGGGSLRTNDPAVVGRLRAKGFVDENDALSMPGLLVLTLAMRRQQAVERLRAGLTS